MNVFISWSGERSKYVAEQLHWWLPRVIQQIHPFVSTQDIKKGARGEIVLSDQLEAANVGIICLTEENREKPWVLFESGALAKLQSLSLVCTYLIDPFKSSMLVGNPLATYQHTKAIDKEDSFQLISSLNSFLSVPLKDEPLRDSFDAWWPQYAKKLKGIPKRPDNEVPPVKPTEDDRLDELLHEVRLLRSGQNHSSSIPQSLIHKDQLAGRESGRTFVKVLTKINNSKTLLSKDDFSPRFHQAIDEMVREGWLIEESKKYLPSEYAIKTLSQLFD